MTEAKTGVSDFVAGPELGRGFFGRVCESTVPPQGAVAVKIIDCERMADVVGLDSWDDLREHLFAEAANLKKAEHENVVRVYGVQNSPSHHEVYIITELCEKQTLGDLAANGPLRLDLAATAIRHALMGLEALHLRGMVHRDLKPSNILKQGPRFKLGDFGLVTDRLVQGYASKQGYTEHLAPETFEVEVTSRSTDVWAMGMTAFRVLNGEPWHDELLRSLRVDRDDHVAARARVEELVTNGDFTRKLKWMPHVPTEWRRFVNKALAYSTASRYHDGGEMLSSMRVPHGPSWDCAYATELVQWRRRRDDQREEVVEWRRHSSRKHEFAAFTRTLDGGGSVRTLSRSGPNDSTAEVFRQLQAFFGTRSE